MDRGVHGRLTSVIPPITVPAWSCMMASRTPGDLGVYGFRNRSDHTYDGRVHRRRERHQGASALGHRRAGGRLLDRRRRARHVSAAAAARRARHVLPHAVGRELVHVSAGPQGRGRRRRRRVHVRREGLPHREQGMAARAALRDDRPPLPAGRAPACHAAVAAVRDGRDGPRPHPPRLLEVHGRGAPQARAWQRVRVGDPRLLPPRRRAHRPGCSSTPTRRRSCSSSPTTARSGSTAASASTSGCGARACSRSRPSRTACACRTRSGSTGRGRRPGETAATTRASSSTSVAASPTV